jgi:hypothetical protein
MARSTLRLRKLPAAKAMKRADSSGHTVTFRLQQGSIRAAFYNQHKNANELEYNAVVRDFWEALFTLSPPVAALIRQNMNDLHLVPGAYVAAHVRALYTSDASDNTDMIRNGINCATKLKPGLPVYFASDSFKATRGALEYGRSKQNDNVTATATVVARIADTEPLHIDRGIVSCCHHQVTGLTLCASEFPTLHTRSNCPFGSIVQFDIHQRGRRVCPSDTFFPLFHHTKGLQNRTKDARCSHWACSTRAQWVESVFASSASSILAPSSTSYKSSLVRMLCMNIKALATSSNSRK